MRGYWNIVGLGVILTLGATMTQDWVSSRSNPAFSSSLHRFLKSIAAEITCETIADWELDYTDPGLRIVYAGRDVTVLSYSVGSESAYKLEKFPSGKHLEIPTDVWESLPVPRRFVPLTTEHVHSFVFVTASNERFFDRVAATIATVQKHFPRRSIVFYDLGLNKSNADKIKSFCNVRYRLFPFDKYPPHVQELPNCAFKALCIQDTLTIFPAVFWIDASVRFSSNNSEKFVNAVVQSKGVLTFTETRHSTYAVTHLDMYRYLPTDIRTMTNFTQHQAGAMMYARTNEVYTQIVLPYVACSLERRCISPDGATPRCSFQNVTSWYVTHVGCHRYDQSALNILTANYFRLERSCPLYKHRFLATNRGAIKEDPGTQICKT